MAKLTKADIRNIEWVNSFESGSLWFEKLRAEHGLKTGTQKNYARSLRRFSKYLKLNPDEMVKDYKRRLREDTNEAVEYYNTKATLFVTWLVDTFKTRRSTAVAQMNAVRSFFNHNAAIHLTAKTPEYRSEPLQPVTLEDLVEAIRWADPFKRFEALFFKDSGISQSDALRLNIGDLKPVGGGFYCIRTFREKENVNYETFVGPNTGEAFEVVKEARKRRGENITADSPLFVKHNKPYVRQKANLIQASFDRLSQKTGIKMSTHRLRKTFETYMALAKIHPVILKYWMGHKVTSDIEGLYIIPPTSEQEKLYREAYKHIDISPKPVDEKQRRIQAILDNARMLGTSEEKIHRIRQMVGRKAISVEKVIEMLKVNETDKSTNNCANGEHCGEQFKEIGENELVDQLNQGWRVVHRLSNGRVIVKR
jgi:integrase